MRILFIDPVCNKPYDGRVLREEPLGGTEATVVRVAEGVAASPKVQHVDVMQHNRTEISGDNPSFLGPHHALSGIPSHVIVLRSPFLLESLRHQFPKAKLYFWAHDEFLWPGWETFFRVFMNTETLPVCVSRWHEQQMLDYATSLSCADFPSSFIYNPIDDDLMPDATPTDPDKLTFFSSPHKGLQRTLDTFQLLRQRPELSTLRLYISNPGYHDDHDTHTLKGITNLGKLSHAKAMEQVRSSFAILHLNTVCPETFGLVHAEANAVGVPFLNADIGATSEICPHPEQFIDANDPEVVAERLLLWRLNGRPKVDVNPAFRRTAVAAEWVRLFASNQE